MWTPTWKRLPRYLQMAALLLLRLLGPRATLRRGIKSVPRSSPAASVNSKTTRRRPTKLKGLVGVMCQFQLVSSSDTTYTPPTYSTTTLPFLETSYFSPAYAYQHSSVPPHPLVLLTLLSHHLFCPVPLLSSPSLSSPSCPPLPHVLLINLLWLHTLDNGNMPYIIIWNASKAYMYVCGCVCKCTIYSSNSNYVCFIFIRMTISQLATSSLIRWQLLVSVTTLFSFQWLNTFIVPLFYQYTQWNTVTNLN